MFFARKIMIVLLRSLLLKMCIRDRTEPFPPLLGEDGGFAPDWYARFDELKGMEKYLSKFKTPEALAKSYAELERLRRYPGVENEEQMARFRRLAGLPESEEEYRLDRDVYKRQLIYRSKVALRKECVD